MSDRKPAAWTNQWIEDLSWRTLRKFTRWSRANPPKSGIAVSRCKRLEAELDRRKARNKAIKEAYDIIFLKYEATADGWRKGRNETILLARGHSNLPR